MTSVFRILAILLFLYVMPSIAQQSAQSSILVVRPNGYPFDITEQGIIKEVAGEFSVARFICSPRTLSTQLYDTINGSPPNLIVLMDNQAVELYKATRKTLSPSMQSIPIVTLLTISIQHAIADLGNATGIAYEIPVATSMMSLRSLIGTMPKRVGIVHRAFLDAFIEQNRAYGKQLGFEIVNYTIPTPFTGRDLKTGLHKILQEDSVDAIWIPVDNEILTPKYIEQYWKPLLKKHPVPVVVGIPLLADPKVQLGTLALTPDHAAMGRQAGQKIRTVLMNNGNAAALPIDPPVSVKKIINGVQARKNFKLTDDDLLSVDEILTLSEAEDSDFSLIASGEMATGLSLANLFNLQVTSVSKTAERMQDVASALYVLTAEDIRRSGATRWQELLNLVPGVWFADASYSAPNAAIREIPSAFMNSVNFLINGQMQQTPITGGPYFGAYSPDLKRYERIEVIKGPGGTIYGANSATGIVSAFSPSLRESKGLRLELTGESTSPAGLNAQYTGAAGDNVDFTVGSSVRYERGYDKNPEFAADTVAAPLPDNSYQTIKNNFSSPDEGKSSIIHGYTGLNARLSKKADLNISYDFNLSRRKLYSFKSMPFDSVYNPAAPYPADSVWLENTQVMFNSLVGQLHYRFTPQHYSTMQLDFLGEDFKVNTAFIGTIHPKYQIANCDIQNNDAWLTDRPIRLSLTWGGNARIVRYDMKEEAKAFIHPVSFEYQYAGLLQGKLSWKDKLNLTAGIKAEAWTLISKKPELLPSLRLSLTPSTRLTFWSAGTRSTTIPGYLQTRFEPRFGWWPPATPSWNYALYQQVMGLDTIPAGAGKSIAGSNGGFLKPTEYYTAEAGCRTTLIPKTTLDFSGFYSKLHGGMALGDYDINFTIPSQINPADTINPVYYTNLLDGRYYGTETVFRIQPLSALRLELSHAWFSYKIWSIVNPNTNTTVEVRDDIQTAIPHHILRYRIYVDLPRQWYLTFNGLWNSPYHDCNWFDYVRQHSSFESSTTIRPGKEQSLFKFDCMVEKMLLDGSLRVFAYGKNLFANHVTETYNFLAYPYPQTVNRIIGGGITYTIKERRSK